MALVRKRPQQDSNLRTWLRRALLCWSLTCKHMLWEGPVGREWTTVRPIGAGGPVQDQLPVAFPLAHSLSGRGAGFALRVCGSG